MRCDRDRSIRSPSANTLPTFKHFSYSSLVSNEEPEDIVKPYECVCVRVCLCVTCVITNKQLLREVTFLNVCIPRPPTAQFSERYPWMICRMHAFCSKPCQSHLILCSDKLNARTQEGAAGLRRAGLGCGVRRQATLPALGPSGTRPAPRRRRPAFPEPSPPLSGFSFRSVIPTEVRITAFQDHP